MSIKQLPQIHRKAEKTRNGKREAESGKTINPLTPYRLPLTPYRLEKPKLFNRISLPLGQRLDHRF